MRPTCSDLFERNESREVARDGGGREGGRRKEGKEEQREGERRKGGREKKGGREEKRREGGEGEGGKEEEEGTATHLFHAFFGAQSIACSSYHLQADVH